MEELFSILAKINYWYRVPDMETGFLRHRYIDKLKESFGNKLIKVIVGQRRVGKSYIIRQLIEYLINDKSVNPKNIFYLNKELYEFDSIKTAADLDRLIRFYKSKMAPNGKVYLFIDEVQMIRDWEKIIVSLAQHSVENYEVFITGSNSRLLSGELATLLSGRYLLFEVFPFSFTEYLEFFNLDSTKDSFIKYLETSGLPETYMLAAEEIRQHYFRSLKDTILLKDIMYRYKIRDYVLLEDLFLFLLHNTGNLISIPSIIKYYKSRHRKTDYSTLAAYIGYMQETFLIRPCPKYSIKTKEMLSGNKKFYVNDLGFRNFLYPQLRTDISAMLENIVFIHLRSAGFEVNVGYFKDFEIDFIATKGEQKIYVQVSYLIDSENTKRREFRPLELINDSFPKYLVTMDEITLTHPQGILHRKVWDFIRNLKDI